MCVYVCSRVLLVVGVVCMYACACVFLVLFVHHVYAVAPLGGWCVMGLVWVQVICVRCCVCVRGVLRRRQVDGSEYVVVPLLTLVYSVEVTSPNGSGSAEDFRSEVVVGVP